MRLWTSLLSFVMICAIAAGAAAQDKKDAPKKSRPTLKERFDKMDTDKDGILTEKEYVAARTTGRHKLTEDQAKELFKKLGGTPDKGLTFEQFEKGMKDLDKERRQHKKDEPKPDDKKPVEKT